MTKIGRAWMLACAASTLWAAPVIMPNGIVNAASNRPVALPGSALARGGLFSIYGTGLGPATGVSASSFPLPTTLVEVSINVTIGGTSLSAILVFVSAGQINGILRSDTPAGRASFRVTYRGETSPPVTAEVVASSFGLITYSGGGLAVAHNFGDDGSLTLNTPANSARPGQIVQVYGTGLGPITAPDVTAPPVGNLEGSFEIVVGGVSARRLYAGRSPCCAGLDQINFEAPVEAPSGCYVPVVVRAGQTYSNAGTIALAAGGGACQDRGNPFTEVLGAGSSGTLGLIELSRVALRVSLLGLNLDSIIDTSTASFFRADPTFFNSGFSLPPPGTCTAFAMPLSSAELDVTPFPVPVNLLDAGGALALGGPGGTREVPRTPFGHYEAQVGGGLSLPGFPPSQPPYLNAGNYRVTGPGGRDIGTFTAELTIPSLLEWTNRDQISSVDRAQALRLTWTGDASGEVVMVFGFSIDAAQSVSGAFVCQAGGERGSFNVPAWVLSTLPVSASISGVPVGALMIARSSLASPARFTARGLDLGVFSYNLASGKLVGYR